MVNQRRGEITAELDGKQWKLCLTLGALAELENKFTSSSLIDLIEKFSSGNLSSTDILYIIAAGLRGGNHSITDDEVSQMRSPDGANGYARIVAQLLNTTFGDSENIKPVNDKKNNKPNSLNPH